MPDPCSVDWHGAVPQENTVLGGLPTGVRRSYRGSESGSNYPPTYGAYTCASYPFTMSAGRLFFVSLLVVTTVLSLGSGLVSAHPLGSTFPAATLSGGSDQPNLAMASSHLPTVARTTKGVPGPLAPSLASRAAFEQRIMSTARADHIPLTAVSLPNLLGSASVTNGVVNPITTVAPNANMFSGGPQKNLENWNLSMVEPSSYSTYFNGHDLTGTIVSSKWQGGNSWADWVAGSTPPYDEFGAIATGGDYFPYPITAYSVTFHLSHLGFGTTWSVTMTGVTLSSVSSTITFYEIAGTYSFTDMIVHDHGSINPANGTVQAVSSNASVSLTHV